jgi:hypothetical protein
MGYTDENPQNQIIDSKSKANRNNEWILGTFIKQS